MISPLNINEYTPSFRGIAIARYAVTAKNDAQKLQRPLTIYRLEPKDIEFLRKLYDKVVGDKKMFSTATRNVALKDIWKNIITNGIVDSIRSLNLKHIFGLKDKSTVCYLAVVDDKPCGLLVGNMPRITNDCKKIVLSRRGIDGDTEINWLATWPNGEMGDIKGAGSALVGEFFNHILKDSNNKSIYLSASLRNRTNARKFYDKMGFKPAQKRTIPLETMTTPREITKLQMAEDEVYQPYTGHFYPLETTIDSAKNKFTEIRKLLHRQALNNSSVDLKKELKI